ncbi:MAG: DUF4131 domain-containing protein [Candidatus Peribacteria bacterium]|jgi:hypothetical protein|nr:DUF4131 domain-containing protein [Candidatus Peribacteria bacterium]
MFLLSFALSIAIYTIWLNAKVGILISLVMCGILMTVSFFLKSNPRSIKHKTPYQQRGMSCLYSILGNMLAFAVICGNLQLQGKEYFNLFLSPSSCTEIQGVHSSERESFNGFGTIIDTQNYHVYLFEDENGKVWRLSTQQTYYIGDQLFLSASVKALDTKVIFDSTFLPPRTAAFRAYQFNYDKWIFMKGIDGTAYEKQAILVPEGGGRFTMAMSIPPEKKL